MTSTPVRPGGPRLTPRQRLLTHLEVGRPDLVFYSGLVSVAGAVLAADDWTFWQLLGAWAAPTCGWFAAMYGGDYFDRELDKITKSQRPLPSGRMRPGEALAGMIAWVLLGMVIAVLLNPLSFVMVVLALSLGVAYSKLLKARGIWGNISRGLITACAFAVGALSTSDSPAWTLVAVALVFALHDAASNVIGALCDQQGDREGGYRTFPVRHGERASLRLMVGLHLLWVLAAIWFTFAWTAPGFDAAGYAALLAVAVAMTLVSVLMLTRSTQPIPRVVGLKSHEVLVIERLVLGSAFVAGAGGIWLGLAILVPFVAATFLSSLFLMRGSYEPSRRWRARHAAHKAAAAQPHP
ncbi:UbiA family prenyltransferase [Actinokineospora sp.]|uniref:UbiA family prenyltransferase n=1 Tax=Actinokineospora sp. TaxID=1872133 RepID=UPI004037F64D